MKKLFTSSSTLWSCLIALVMMMASQSAWAEYVPLTALSGTGGTGGEGYASLVDAKVDTKMGHSFDPANPDRALAYIVVKAEKAVKPEWYFLVTGGDTGSYPTRNWKTWKIFGGNFASDAEAVRGNLDDPESTGWTLLDYKEDEPLPQANTEAVNLQFDYTGEETFQYFWIEILESVAGSDIWLQMSEWGLGSYGDFEAYLQALKDKGTELDEPVNYFLVAGEPGGFGGEGVANLIDGNTGNKWCTGFTNREEGATENGAYIIFGASRRMAPTYYSMVTGNDTGNNPGRNWKQWHIYGMNAESEADVTRNSDNWVLLDNKYSIGAGTGMNQLPAANFATAYFTPSEANTTQYKYFKIEIDQCVSDGLMQMSEFSLGDEYTLALDRNALLTATAERYDAEDFAEAALYAQMAQLIATINACTDPIQLGQLGASVDELVAKINASKNNYGELISARNAAINQLADNNVADAAVAYVNGWINETDPIAPSNDYPVGNFAYIKANRQITGEQASAEAKRFSSYLQANVKVVDDPIGDVGYTFLSGTTDNWNAGEGPEYLIDGQSGINGTESTKWGTATSGDRFVIFKSNAPIKPTYYGLVTGGDTGVYTERNWKNWKIWAANFASDEEATKDSEGWVLIDVKENVGTDILKTTSLFESYINLSIGCAVPYEYFKIEVYHEGGMQMNEFTFYNQGDLNIYRQDFIAEFEGYDPAETTAYVGYVNDYNAKYLELLGTSYAPDLMKIRNELRDLQEQIQSSADLYVAYQDVYFELDATDMESESLSAWKEGYTTEKVGPSAKYIRGTYAYIVDEESNLGTLDNDGIQAETEYLQRIITAVSEDLYILLGGHTVGEWGDGFYGNLIDGIALNEVDPDTGEEIKGTKWGGMADANGDTYIIFRTLDKVNPFFYTLTTGNDTGNIPGRNWGTWYIYGANFEGDGAATKDAEGWVLVDAKEDVGQDRLHPVNAQPSYFGFSTETTEPYLYYKVVVTKAYSGNAIQMNELHFGTEEEFDMLKIEYTDAANEFDTDIVADQALLDEYEETVPEIDDCMNMEALFRVNYHLETLRDAINTSAALYAKFQATVEENKAYLAENALADSEAKTIFENYLNADAATEPSELYPNGPAAYILDEHVLNDSVLTEEFDFMESLKVAAVAAGYGPGMEISSLIKNRTFAKAGETLKDEKGNNIGREAEGWNGYIYRTASDGEEGNDIFAAEFCNENKTFDVNQTITNLKNGYYKVTLNAGFRANGDDKMLSYNYAAMAYANEVATYVPVLREGAAQDEESAWKGTYADKQIYSLDSTETYGWGIWGCEGASHAFAQGRYAITMVAKVTDGTLTIGVKNEGTTGNDWTGVGNFALTYLGEDAAAALQEAAEYNAARINTLTELYEPIMVGDDGYDTAPGFGAAQKAILAENSGVATYEAAKLIGETMQSIYETKKAYVALLDATTKVYTKWCEYAASYDAEDAIYAIRDNLTCNADTWGAYDDAEAALAAKAQLFADYPDYLEVTANGKVEVDQEEFTFSLTTTGTRPYVDLKNIYEPFEEGVKVTLAFDYIAEQDVENGKIMYNTPNLMTDPTENLPTLAATAEWTTVYVDVNPAIKALNFGSAENHGIRWYINYNATANDEFKVTARNFRFIKKKAQSGDLNEDGKIDIADAVNVLKAMAENPNDTAFDVNGDGKVDIADFVSILKMMAE